MSEATDLLNDICIMLRQRAYRGNSQLKHGIDAAYAYECAELVSALDDWLTRRQRMRGHGVSQR